eukprot:4116508-Heterocapsa_arctica.AAC.1
MTRDSDVAIDSSESGPLTAMVRSGEVISASSAERNDMPSARAISDSSTVDRAWARADIAASRRSWQRFTNARDESSLAPMGLLWMSERFMS